MPEATNAKLWKKTGFKAALTALVMALGIAVSAGQSAHAQEIRMSKAEHTRLNGNRIGIVTGGNTGTYIKLGDDLRRLLDDHTDLSMRVVNMAGRGSIGNLRDLLYLDGVDVAIVQSDVLAHLRNTQPDDYDYLYDRIRYLTRVYNEEIHILARDGITDVADLDGKTVAVGGLGGGTSITADILFRRVFRIAPDLAYMSQREAMARLKAGTIDAMMYVVGKPSGLFRELSGQDIYDHGLNFVGVSAEAAARARSLKDATYAEALLNAKDYEGLIAEGDDVLVLAVPAIMAVYDWNPKGGPRARQQYANLENFVNRMFAAVPKLDGKGYHSKWCQMDIRGALPGWQRFAPASAWIAQNPGAQNRVCPAMLVERDNTRIVKANEPEVSCTFSRWMERQAPAIVGTYDLDGQQREWARAFAGGLTSC